MRNLGPLALLILLGCDKNLPEQVPVTAKVFWRAGELSDPPREKQLDGLPLVHKDQVLGTLKHDEPNQRAELSFIRPKSEVRSLAAGGFSVRYPGACGIADIPLTGPGLELWSDSGIASSVAANKSWRLDLYMSKDVAHQVAIDWGTASSISIGAMKLDKTEATEKKFVVVVVSGCTIPPKIVVGGKEIGSLSLEAPLQLISLPENVCYVHEFHTYGDLGAGPRPTFYSGKHVYILDSKPSHLFGSAPSSLTSKFKAAVRTSLEQIACPIAH